MGQLVDPAAVQQTQQGHQDDCEAACGFRV